MNLSSLRITLHNILEKEGNHKYSWLGKIYAIILIIATFVCILPLMFKEHELHIFDTSNTICLFFFILDYLLRWFTADIKHQHKKIAFLYYPFTPMAICDLLSILPSFHILSTSFNILRSLRLLKFLRILRLLRYSKEMKRFFFVIKKQRSILITTLTLSLIYIFLSALLIFHADPDHFHNFFEALYWATTTFTTVGYGDICPRNEIGRLISMISSLIGVAIIALPAGVITASYIKAIEDENPKKNYYRNKRKNKNKKGEE